MKSSNRFWKIFDQTITFMMWVSAVIVLLLAAAITIDVLMRYFFSKTYSPLFEITEYSLLWMTFLGAPWIMRKNGHVRVDIIVNLLKPAKRIYLNTIASFLSTIVLIVLTIVCAKLTLHDFITDFHLPGIVRPLKWPIEGIIPVGLFLLMLQTLRMTNQHCEILKSSFDKHDTSEDGPNGGEQ